MNSPLSNDPGGVNEEQYYDMPETARDLNLSLDAGEAIDQFKASLRYNGDIGKGLSLNTYGFYSSRNFEGRVPVAFNGVIAIDRDFYGHGTSLTSVSESDKVKWTALLGYEISAQRDFRERWANIDGSAGDIRLSQDESFTNYGFYFINDIEWNQLTVNTAIRYDANQIEIGDRFLENGDNSGDIDLNDFNYSIGASYSLSEQASLFASHSTSFETPTLNELGQNPDGSGFNPNLTAQTANHFELGMKAALNQTTFQISLFSISAKDELVEFEDVLGNAFFRNVGETKRRGVEVFLRHPLSEAFNLSTNWSINRFVFGSTMMNEDLEDNWLPGLPDYQGFVQLDYAPIDNFNVTLQNQFLGRIFTNNDNSVFQEEKLISNLSASYQWNMDNFSIHPYFGVNNLFGTFYADNIRINAFGSRFWEAAPEQVFYGGVRFSF